MKLKICGLTRTEDVIAAIAAGADYLGFIFYPKSPRYVTEELAAELTALVPAGIQKVGVFVNRSAGDVISTLERCHLDIAQLHGSETDDTIRAVGAERVWKAFSLRSEADLERAAACPAATILADAPPVNGLPGGTGRICDWRLAAMAARRFPLVLAGGLKPANLPEAITAVKPFAVDLCSGLEREPGRKDHEQLKLLRSYFK